MRPYYEAGGIQIYHGDCREILPTLDGVVVTDPPYNIGYHYARGGDNRTEQEYDSLLVAGLRLPSVVVCYPEVAFRASRLLGVIPKRSAAWVYPANTPRQWRIVCWFGVEGFPENVPQEYRNPTDKRIAERIANGEMARGYDWWEEPQVKNVSEEKTDHPCQNPLSVMSRILQATEAPLVVDPFMGSGTTLRAAKDLGRRAIGIELEERYCEIAARRLDQEVLAL